MSRMEEFTPDGTYTAPTDWKQNASGIPQLQNPASLPASFTFASSSPSQTLPAEYDRYSLDAVGRISNLLYTQTETMKQMVAAFTQTLSKLLPSAPKSAGGKPAREETPPIPVVLVEEKSGKEEMLEISLTDARNEYQTYKDKIRWSLGSAALLGLLFSASFVCLITFNVMALTKLDTSPYTIVTQECSIVGFVADDCTTGGRVQHDYSCRKNVPVVEYSDLCSRKANGLPLHQEKTHSILTKDFRVVNFRNMPERYNEEKQVDRSAIVPETSSGGSDVRLCRVEYHHISQQNSFCGIVGAEFVENHHLSGNLGQYTRHQLFSESEWAIWMVSLIFCCIFILPAIGMYSQALRIDGARAYVADVLWNNGHDYETHSGTLRKIKHSKIADSDSDDDDD